MSKTKIKQLKLQSRVNRRVGKKEYRKYYVDIPAKTVEEAGWTEGDEIDTIVKHHEVILKLKK